MPGRLEGKVAIITGAGRTPEWPTTLDSLCIPFVLTRSNFFLPCCNLPPSSGIGFESSVLFAKEGAHVIAADINVDAAQATVDKIATLFGAAHDDGKQRAVAVKADVSNEEQVRQLVDQAVEKF
ncbi:hypothetical protein BC936DRAFT_136900, partial [Jimgerdemannia flammicorona]